jgi:endonuclease G, mitochondrial
MLFRKFFYAFTVACFIITGCQNILPTQQEYITIQPLVTTPAIVEESPYTITEDFETDEKANYTEEDVKLITGIWHFKSALLGEKESDVKNGLQSARIRSGFISMKFDLAGVKQINIKHAKYGNDPDSKWQLYFSVDSGNTYLPIGAAINETDTVLKTDSFAFNISKKVRFKIVKKGSARINVDDITFKGVGDAGIIMGLPDMKAPDTIKVPSGAKRGVIVGSDAPPVMGDNSNMLFGNPSGAQPVMAMADNYLMDMGYYIESYNNTRAAPNWVSWHLDATNITCTSERLNNFAAFNGLPNNWFAVKSNSYSYSTYGFDRGHNCPSADRSSSVNANSATFLMTNMIPQAPNNNQETWGNFEDYLRSLALQGNEVYIIMGSYGSGGTGAKGYFSSITSGNYKINVPAYIWKVALIIPAGNNDISRVGRSTRVIAINTPNKNNINKDWKLYQVSVRAVELATGYDLLSNLPQPIQDALETTKYPL